MINNYQMSDDKLFRMRGISAVEIILVLLLISILAAVAIPELIISRKLWQFAGMRQQIVASLREARQMAMSQNRRITLQYNDDDKTLRIFDDNLPLYPVGHPLYNAANPTLAPEGGVGILGNPSIKIVHLATNGVLLTDIVYGRPVGAPLGPLDDTTTFTALSGNIVNVTFNARGDVVDRLVCTNPPRCTNAPRLNPALFFYNNFGNSQAAFAISILGTGGRIRVWTYNGTDYE